MHYLEKIKGMFKNKKGVDLEIKNQHEDA